MLPGTLGSSKCTPPSRPRKPLAAPRCLTEVVELLDPGAMTPDPLVTTACLGVCSWSLQPATPAELARRVTATGLQHAQLALDPLRVGAWRVGRTLDRLRDAGVEVRSGMLGMRDEDYSTIASIRRTGGLRSDATWPANRAAAAQNAKLAARLGLRLVSFHAGFLPHERTDRERATLLERLGEVADVFADEGVTVALETGQETAEVLLDVLAELGRANVGVNFDPANMLLYGMGEPVAALAALAPHVRQIHVKDARRSGVPEQWGEEVPVGQGEVDWRAFFDVVRREGIDVDLMIEREAGTQRVDDIRAAAAIVRPLALGVGGASA